MWEILWSRDFLLNLAAGGVIFVLEVAVITALLPWLLQRRLDRRWRPVRNSIALAFTRSVGSYSGALEVGLARAENSSLTREHLVETICGTHDRLVESFLTNSAGLTPELARTSSHLLDLSRTLSRSLLSEIDYEDSAAHSNAVNAFKSFAVGVSKLSEEMGLGKGKETSQEIASFEKRFMSMAKLWQENLR